ncbi:MAG: phage baseplate assembly protein V, partial [Sphingomonadales bacterium]
APPSGPPSAPGAGLIGAMAAMDISINGDPLPPGIAASLTSASVCQALNAPAMALLGFADTNADAIAGLHLGSGLIVTAPDGACLIDAEVTAIEERIKPDGVRTLVVRGYDRLHRLRKRQRVRAKTSVNLADLLDEAAQDIGASVAVGQAAFPVYSTLIQHDQSDFELLVEIAGACGCFLQLDDGTLRAFTLGGEGGDAIPLAIGDKLLEAKVELNAETMRRSTLARGWNIGSTLAVEKQVSVAAQDAVEMRGGDALEHFEGLGERLLVNRLSQDEDEAGAIAQADMDRATALVATLTGIAEGDAALRPGRAVQIEGVSDAADGTFVLTETVHRFDAPGGYVTRISTVPPERLRRSRSAAVTFAKVTDVEDPEGLARVRGKLVAFGDVESDWMPVLIVGAGTDKGVSVLPEPDDDVLVLLPEGDPARGVVLGGLYGERNPPGERRGSSARTFTMRTPGGQCLTLDSVEALVRLETSAGDVLEMTPEGTRLSVTRDLTIEAPGRALKIRAKSVDFERAT